MTTPSIFTRIAMIATVGLTLSAAVDAASAAPKSKDARKQAINHLDNKYYDLHKQSTETAKF